MRLCLRNAAAPALLGLALLAAGCQSNQARVVSGSAEHDEQMLGRIAALEGEWHTTTTEGEADPGAIFTVSSADSSVREIMFPGTDHEMTNMYHMDGNRLVVTHYCAAGNQPRMVAEGVRQTEEGTVYEFDVDSVSNLRPEHDHYMGKMTLTILNDGTVRQDWQSYDREGELTPPFTFNLRRSPGA